MKKKIALVLTAAMAVGTLAGCGSSTAQTTTSEQASAQTTDKTEGGADTVETKPAPAGAKVVKFGNSGAIGEPAPQSCEEFCDLVNDKIGDRYYFEFYPAEQLGNETTMLENLQVGLQEGMMCALDTLATYESDLNILSMAFAFNNYDSMINYLKSDVADPIWESLDNQGIHVVNFEFQKNPRIFFANKEIKSPKDMVGMKYAYPVEQICFSTQFWNSLSEEDQKVISDAAAQVASHHSERTLDKWEEDKEWLINEGGVTFCDIDRQAFIDAAEPLGKELQDEGFFTTKDLYDQTRQFNK